MALACIGIVYLFVHKCFFCQYLWRFEELFKHRQTWGEEIVSGVMVMVIREIVSG